MFFVDTLIKDGIVGAIVEESCGEGVAIAEQAISDQIDYAKDKIKSKVSQVIIANPYVLTPVVIMVGIIIAAIWIYFWGDSVWTIFKLPVYLLAFISFLILGFGIWNFIKLNDKVDEIIYSNKDKLINMALEKCSESGNLANTGANYGYDQATDMANYAYNQVAPVYDQANYAYNQVAPTYRR